MFNFGKILTKKITKIGAVYTLNCLIAIINIVNIIL